MELVRRSTGRYTLALPQYLPLQPSDLKLLHTLHPRCVNCLTHPPANWSVAQVASQLREAALQGRQPASERVGRLFEARGVDGAALVALPGRRGLQKLGVDADDARQLLPWLRRVQSSNPKVWGYGVHCCARWLSNMPGKREWLDALRLPELGPVRGKMATVHRLSTNAPGRRWLEAFKALHQVHQWYTSGSYPPSFPSPTWTWSLQVPLPLPLSGASVVPRRARPVHGALLQPAALRLQPLRAAAAAPRRVRHAAARVVRRPPAPAAVRRRRRGRLAARRVPALRDAAARDARRVRRRRGVRVRGHRGGVGAADPPARLWSAAAAAVAAAATARGSRRAGV